MTDAYRQNYDFRLGQLSPKQQAISWFKRSGRLTASITNTGNRPTSIRLEAADYEQACSFEIQGPDDLAAQAVRTEIRLSPDQEAVVSVKITPPTRPLFPPRRVHRFTLTATALDGHGKTVALLGELRRRPLFGPLSLLLFIAGLFAGGLFLLWPSAYTFTADDQVAPVVIRSGQTATLAWRVSPFAAVYISPDLEWRYETSGTVRVDPLQTTTYELEAANLLSVLFPFFDRVLGETSREVTVFVDPAPPVIHEFQVNSRNIRQGEQVTLVWQVSGARELILAANGAPETLAGRQGRRFDKPATNTTYRLTARNDIGQTHSSLVVKVSEPPLPTPVIKKFVVRPEVIVQGERVRLEWEIEGADRVDIEGIGHHLPRRQILSHSPLRTTRYVLTAFNGPAPTLPLPVTVTVHTPLAPHRPAGPGP